jgi:hypothetical protein
MFLFLSSPAAAGGSKRVPEELPKKADRIKKEKKSD